MTIKNVAVIGCGTIANAAHLPAYAANPMAKLKYVCDIIPERADAAKEKYGAEKAVYDYHEILDDPTVDCVSICVHNYMHEPIAIDFLNHGKDVLCEKPASVTFDKVLNMKAAADRNDRILNIGVVNRFNTAVNRIKKMIEDGKLGNVYHIYCSFRSWRSIPGLGGQFTQVATAGGGVLIDWGVHYLDLIFHCIGNVDIRTVSGETYSCLGRDMRKYDYLGMWAGPPDYDGTYDVEEFVTGFIRTSGPTITLNGAWAQNIGENATFIEFLGDRGGIKLQYGGGFTYWTTEDGALLEVKPSFRTEEMFPVEIDSFLKSSDAHEKICSNIDNVLVTARVMQGLYDSAKEKKEIVM